jgi:hypothetical protein
MHALTLLLAFALADTPSSQPVASTTSPYSLPWQLRSVTPTTVVRIDTGGAFYAGGMTSASMLFASYKVIPALAPFVRLGYVANAVPGQATGNSFVNPALGAAYGLQLPADLRLGVSLGMTLPVGLGGGNTPDLAAKAAAQAGILARSAMDNAMFAVNDLTVFPGVDLAWVAHGFTLQAEATLLMLTRVRGENVQPDAFKVNLTTGVHAGYFIFPQWSVGVELRYQRWLTTPVAVAKTPAARDNLSLAAGTRVHIKAGSITLRPGVAYARGLEGLIASNDYNVLFVDLPIAF